MPKSVFLSRRNILIGVGIVAAGGAGGTALFARRDRFAGGEMTPEEVLAAVKANEVHLIDIRRPDEWAATGVPAGGHPIDMRRPDFLTALQEVTHGRVDVPIALICARGVRSDRLSARLTDAGFTQIVDVPEGMLGSAAGPGWLGRGLPTRDL
ncbi:MAG: rhodanese-like domain-containing protein [Pseudomonadota bacterium]